MQTVIVAGGAGFIGSALCGSLVNDGYIVICIDNLITGDKNNIKELLENPNFKFIEYDITKPFRQIFNFKFFPPIAGSRFGGTIFNFVFHLASPASPNKRSKRSYINHPIETLLANSVGTYNLLELSKKVGAKFLYASSSEIYGDPTISPQSEKYFGNVNPNGVRSAYDEGKRFGEALTMGYVRKYNIDARIVRIFNTYGANMQADDGRVISNFINQAINNSPITIYGDGNQTRSFCYVDDMIEGLKRAMFKNNTKGEVVNLGNPDERKILDLAKLIKTMTNSSSNIIFEEAAENDPRSRNPDISKAKRLLDWTHIVALEDGLRKTIKYFKKT